MGRTFDGLCQRAIAVKDLVAFGPYSCIGIHCGQKSAGIKTAPRPIPHARGYWVFRQPVFWGIKYCDTQLNLRVEGSLCRDCLFKTVRCPKHIHLISYRFGDSELELGLGLGAELGLMSGSGIGCRDRGVSFNC